MCVLVTVDSVQPSFSPVHFPPGCFQCKVHPPFLVAHTIGAQKRVALSRTCSGYNSIALDRNKPHPPTEVALNKILNKITTKKHFSTLILPVNDVYYEKIFLNFQINKQISLLRFIKRKLYMFSRKCRFVC